MSLDMAEPQDCLCKNCGHREGDHYFGGTCDHISDQYKHHDCLCDEFTATGQEVIVRTPNPGF